MTLFSSRPPFNDDPEPYRDIETDQRYWRKDDSPSSMDVFDPRPEYDRPQHNPTNPILVAARKLFPEGVYYRDLERWPTEAEIIHASKVLGRRKAVFG